MVGEWSLSDLEIRYQHLRRYCRLEDKCGKNREIMYLCDKLLVDFESVLDWLRTGEVSEELIELAERYTDLLQETFDIQVQLIESETGYIGLTDYRINLEDLLVDINMELSDIYEVLHSNGL